MRPKELQRGRTFASSALQKRLEIEEEKENSRPKTNKYEEDDDFFARIQEKEEIFEQEKDKWRVERHSTLPALGVPIFAESDFLLDAKVREQSTETRNPYGSKTINKGKTRSLII